MLSNFTRLKMQVKDEQIHLHLCIERGYYYARVLMRCKRSFFFLFQSLEISCFYSVASLEEATNLRPTAAAHTKQVSSLFLIFLVSSADVCVRLPREKPHSTTDDFFSSSKFQPCGNFSRAAGVDSQKRSVALILQ